MPIPPGGYAGFAQMTPASRLALTRGTTMSRGTKRRRKSKKTKTKRAGKRRSTKRKSKMKFGSPAWQKKYKVGKYRK